MGTPSASDATQVHNLNLAAFLDFRGHDLQAYKWEGDRCSWFFAWSESLDDDITAYEEGRALVDPKAYVSRLTKFKRVIYTDRPS